MPQESLFWIALEFPPCSTCPFLDYLSFGLLLQGASDSSAWQCRGGGWGEMARVPGAELNQRGVNLESRLSILRVSGNYIYKYADSSQLWVSSRWGPMRAPPCGLICDKACTIRFLSHCPRFSFGIRHWTEGPSGNANMTCEHLVPMMG